MLLQLFLDNSRPAMSKASLDFVFFKIWRSGTNFAFSPLYLSEPLRKQKVVVCDSWLVHFDPFCVFLCFKVLYFVFEKHRKFYLSSKFFFVFFGLKHGKFRFPRWNCSYRASKSRGNTHTHIRKGENELVRSRQHLHLLKLKHSGCYGNGLIEVAEKFEFWACLIWIVGDFGRGSFLFPIYLGRSKETLFAG